MRILLLAALAVLFSSSAEAGKRKLALIGLSDSVSSVSALDELDKEGTEFPSDAEYGYYRSTFTLFFIPIASWGGDPVVASDSEETVWTLEGPVLAYFEDKYGVAADEYGGWVKYCNYVTGLVIAAVIFLKVRAARS